MKKENSLAEKQCENKKVFILQKNFLNNIDDILCNIDFVKKGKTQKLSNVASVFDIEATSFYKGKGKDAQKQCCMYAWVFGINGKCIRGRTWGEFLEVLHRVKEYYDISIDKRFVIYIHNLSYEFQWFKNYFEWDKVFSLDQRKPIYAITKDGFEFRCSYLLSGYNLATLGKNLTKYKVQKMVGDLDYKLIRHSKTILTDKEWGYILNDGLVVMAYIQEEIERLGNISKIPITKTGYVRNLCREKCLRGDNKFQYSKLIKSLTLTPETYRQLKRTYTGGFTHANINYVNKLVDNVHSFDFTSSYPTVMISEKYPMSKPMKLEIKNDEDLLNKLDKYCCMFDCVFHNIRAKVDYENYISISRCSAEHYVLNNGRVIEAEELSISLTEQDFFIIRDMYEWDSIEIYNFNCFYKDYLPKDFILTILKLYEDKTTLKGVPEKVAEYMVSKGMINSCYGMCVTDPCRDDIIYEEDWSVKKADIDTLIEVYNKNGNRFLYYAWGVWVTAYARRNLFSGINEFKNDYLYSDTDSIKVVNIDKHKKYIEDYNVDIKKKLYECLKHYDIPTNKSHPKTIKGIEKPLGVWDYEGMYTRFKTLGAKRYMVEKDGNIEITIAGVSKSSGKEYLYHKYKDNTSIFNAFNEDLYFPPHYEYEENGKKITKSGSGKLCHTYIDTYMEGEIIDYMGVKYVYNEQSGVHLEDTDYTLSLDSEFKKLIFGIKGGHICKR